jgi:hypothetical protein
MCDVPVALRVDGDLEARRLDGLLQRHFALSATPTERSAEGRSLEIALDREGNSPFSRSARLVEETLGLRVLRNGTGFSLEAGDSWIDLEPSRGVATGGLCDGFWDLPELTQRDFFLQTLVILLRDRHLFGLHASGVERNGTGVLVVGPSGQGKTTLTLSLLAAGWGFLGDDVVALHQVNAVVEALAVRRSMSCTPTTLARFGMEGSDAANGEKQLVDVEFMSAGQVVDHFHPNLLVFPEVTDRQSSELEPLNEPEVIAHLGRSMAGIMTDPVWAERQLGVLVDLAAQSAGYRMLAGRDVFEDPPRVARLLTDTGRVV